MKSANIAGVVFVQEFGANPNSVQHIRIYICLKLTFMYIFSSTLSCSKTQKNFTYLDCSVVSEREDCVTIKINTFEHS
jgi:hypothetical protein